MEEPLPGTQEALGLNASPPKNYKKNFKYIDCKNNKNS
jgi:hypothetical protein